MDTKNFIIVDKLNENTSKRYQNDEKKILNTGGQINKIIVQISQ
jgi:hypothetical protein